MFCIKLPYDTYQDAHDALVGFKRRRRNERTGKRLHKNYVPVRVYKCDACGAYHLTSKKNRK